MATGNYETVDPRVTYARTGPYMPPAIPAWGFYGPSFLGLGAIAAGNYPRDSRFTGRVKSQTDESQSAIVARARSLASGDVSVQTVWKEQLPGRHASGARDYRIHLTVRTDRPVTAGEITSKLRALLNALGFDTASYFEAVVREVPSRSSTSYRYNSSTGRYEESSTPALSPRSTSTPAPAPVPIQSAPCTSIGGRCYDYTHPPANLGEGRWVRGKCADVDGLSTRCFVPTAATAAPAPAPGRPASRPTGGGGGDASTSASLPTSWDGGGGGIDWNKVVLWGLVGVLGVSGVALVARYLQAKRAARKLRSAGRSTPHRTVVDFGAPVTANRPGGGHSFSRNRGRRRNMSVSSWTEFSQPWGVFRVGVMGEHLVLQRREDGWEGPWVWVPLTEWNSPLGEAALDALARTGNRGRRGRGRRRNPGQFSVWMRRQGTQRWKAIHNLSREEADDVFETHLGEPRLAELIVAEKSGRQHRHYQA